MLFRGWISADQFRSDEFPSLHSRQENNSKQICWIYEWSGRGGESDSSACLIKHFILIRFEVGGEDTENFSSHFSPPALASAMIHTLFCRGIFISAELNV